MSLVRYDSWERPLVGGKGPKLGLSLFSPSRSVSDQGPGSPLFLLSPTSQPSSPDKSPPSAGAAGASPFSRVPRKASLPLGGKPIRRQLSNGLSRFANESKDAQQAAALTLLERQRSFGAMSLGGRSNSLSGLSLPSLPDEEALDLNISDEMETDSADSATQSYPEPKSDTSTSQDIAESGFKRDVQAHSAAAAPEATDPQAEASANILLALSHRLNMYKMVTDHATTPVAVELSSPAGSVSCPGYPTITTGLASHAVQQLPSRNHTIETCLPKRSKKEASPGRSTGSAGPKGDSPTAAQGSFGLTASSSLVASCGSSRLGATACEAAAQICKAKRKTPEPQVAALKPDRRPASHGNEKVWPRRTSRHTPAVSAEASTTSPCSELPEEAGKKKKLGRKKLARQPCRGCGILETPQWRRGPDGKRNLCNKCGVRHRKGLLPPLPPYPEDVDATDRCPGYEGDSSAPGSPQ
mmetsp:Transcript_14919/g.41923  ORF Transcript_14919/g.41923 Transcript_14919/m.41923 type:complete len:469 (-) Transcript_14919:359-1765(-)